VKVIAQSAGKVVLDLNKHIKFPSNKTKQLGFTGGIRYAVLPFRKKGKHLNQSFPGCVMHE